MNILAEFGIESVNHYTPLHYSVFIARSNALLGKPSLKAMGFKPCHLRSMSSKHDVARGFGEYAFLTIDPKPRILGAKLSAGFPHIAIRVPNSAFDGVEFSLCRFNVAMTRFLRRRGKPGFPASPANGNYYGAQQIPTARTKDEKQALLAAHLKKGTMIEVLIHGDLPLPSTTKIVCYDDADVAVVKSILDELSCPWHIIKEPPPRNYPRRADYARAVDEFVEKALADAGWRGNCLEFDRV